MQIEKEGGENMNEFFRQYERRSFQHFCLSCKTNYCLLDRRDESCRFCGSNKIICVSRVV